MNIKVVIPARYGSSRLPRKPLLLIKGYPIFWHVVQRVKEAGIAEGDILLATDHIMIEKEAKNLGVPVFLTSDSHESGTDRLNEVSIKKGWDKDTIIINVQGDEPLIPPALIKQLIGYAKNNPKIAICTAVVPINDVFSMKNPNVVKTVLSKSGKALYFSRSEIPFDRDKNNTSNCFYRHIGIYSYTAETLLDFCSFETSSLENTEKLEQLRALENDLSIGAFVYSGEIPHGIDTQDDYESIKRLME
ncbi:MAG: 3-deoxy-manno-octulosonate cytidylyltransferase [Pseudoalteromonas distincta]|uniref:3-deoxy-manno-octulosonate cytidylyltransferase n=1 Tax=Pseudoalteromonas distincta TaxID=77608 RepID=UPI003F9BD47E